MSRLIIAVIAVFLAVPAMAEQPSFNYIQAGYQEVNLDAGGGFDVDGDGFGLGGSVEFADSFFGFVSYSDIGFDFSVDLTQIQVGLGWQMPLGENTSFFATAAYVEAEVSATGFGSEDESGYGLGIGIRSNVSELIELFAGINHVDFGDGDSTGFGGGIFFNITEAFALGLSASTDDDVTSWGANVRYYFGD